VLKFGTDGVRGVANLELTPELVVAFGRAAARVLGCGHCVIGRDTRRSGPFLEAALVAGLAAEGVQVTLLGVAPTPAVAWLAAADGMIGAVISASHNSFEDNGVKLFTAEGRKLSDEVEAALEAELHALLQRQAPTPARTGAAVGTITDGSAAVDRWAEAVQASIEGRRLDRLRVVVDCANGAASLSAPGVLRALGATVDVLHAEPDGTNINAACGSTHPDDVRQAVVQHGADVGIAFDGDADRVLAVDGNGRVIDGDQIIAVAAIDRRDRGLLAQDTVVVTVMTNLGFRLGMVEHGIKVLEVPVGDRHVLQALVDGSLTLGGEQSGHVVFADLATTGDGLLTAVQLLDVMSRSRLPLADLADAAMTKLPQVLRNVSVAHRLVDVGAALASQIAAVQEELGDRGRVLVRGSGTERLVRVMVEAPTVAAAEAAADRLVLAVEGLNA
jgi:phosphoglucosamine mutase